MLTLKQHNMDVFKQHALNNYIERMCKHIRVLYPEIFYTLRETDVRSFIEESIQKARLYGLLDEYAVTRFLDYRLLLGNEFELLENNQWILNILTDESYSELAKIAAIDRIQFCYITEREA